MAAQVGAYLKFMAQAIAGLIAHGSIPMNIVSGSATTVIRFGRAVGVTATDSDVVSEGLGTRFLGIAVRETAKENNAVAAESKSYAATDTVGIMQAGNIWVDVDVNVIADGNPVYFDDTTGIFFGASAVGRTLINGASFVGSTNNGVHEVLLEGVSVTTPGT